ncbi:MAG: hypothetical protein RLZZ303_803 [Candidatus Hydrogenedentota bacterium]|jgi:predicted RNase H-like HicB family nuclease
MRNEFTVIIEQDEDWYIGYCLEVPGANGQGQTVDECKQSVTDAIALILEDRREDALRGVPENARREVVVVESRGKRCSRCFGTQVAVSSAREAPIRFCGIQSLASPKRFQGTLKSAGILHARSFEN